MNQDPSCLFPCWDPSHAFPHRNDRFICSGICAIEHWLEAWYWCACAGGRHGTALGEGVEAEPALPARTAQAASSYEPAAVAGGRPKAQLKKHQRGISFGTTLTSADDDRASSPTMRSALRWGSQDAAAFDELTDPAASSPRSQHGTGGRAEASNATFQTGKSSARSLSSGTFAAQAQRTVSRTAASSKQGSEQGTVARSGKSVSAQTMRLLFQQLGNDNVGGQLDLPNVEAALQGKRPPSQALQLWVVTQRAAVKQFRGFYPTFVVDITLLLAASCVVGGIHGTGWNQAQAPSNATMAMTTLATLTGVTFLRTFVKVRYVT